MTIYDLKAVYDSRASFYGKASVSVNDDGSEDLYSYNTKVVSVKPNGDLKFYSNWDSSPTTLRHVKEFLKQKHSNLGYLSKAQIAGLITVED